MGQKNYLAGIEGVIAGGVATALGSHSTPAPVLAFRQSPHWERAQKEEIFPSRGIHPSAQSPFPIRGVN